MSGKRYPEEFKIEAVKQVVDRGQRAFRAAFARAKPLAGVKKGTLAKAGAVHVPGTAGQIVRFID